MCWPMYLHYQSVKLSHFLLPPLDVEPPLPAPTVTAPAPAPEVVSARLHVLPLGHGHF